MIASREWSTKSPSEHLLHGDFSKMPVTLLRGFTISREPKHVRRLDMWRYQVKSQSGRGWYNITWNKRIWVCDCPFNTRTHQRCKHIAAVLFRITGPQDATDEAYPICGTSKHVVGRGNYETRTELVKRYECNRCRVKFTSRTGFSGLWYRANMVTAAIDLYFKGVSLRGIADHLNQQYGCRMTHVTVLRWIRKYLAIVRRYVGKHKPKLSDKYHVDEMKIKVGGDLQNLWNLLDHHSRYLVAIQVTAKKGSAEAKRLLKGLNLTKPVKVKIISDGLPSYQTAVRELNSHHRGLHLTHLADRGLTKRNSNNRLERLNGTIRGRLKTMAGLKNSRSSRIFAEDFRSYYNYIRPHLALNGRTPSEAAKTWKPKEHNRWRSLIRDSQNWKRTNSRS